MRKPISELEGQSYDVAVIGAGANGASAAQHLAAAGFNVLVVDKGDFASGSSSRSSRLLHCGLRYLAPGDSMWEFLRSPRKLCIAMRMARQAMESRAQLVETAPERVERQYFCFPIYAEGPYAPWQVSLAFRLLGWLGPKSVPLDFRLIEGAEIDRTPLARWLPEREKLLSVAMFSEYRFEWPERIILDEIIDAERLGAEARNYTALTGMERDAERGWTLTLTDQVRDGELAHVSAKIVLNMAGIWIDKVNALAAPGARRRITGTKGTHIMVRLPPECANFGLVTINRLNEPYYCFPWRGLHFFGPTETLYEGDPDGVRPLDQEIDWLIDETNHTLPALGLRREHILFAWSGVRPLGADPEFPKGKRSREVHDLAADGLPGVYAMTGGPIMTHRSAGPEMTELVSTKIKPSRGAQAPSYAARSFPMNQNSPPLLDDYTSIKLSDLAAAARSEHPVSLIDLMFRRVGAGWTATMGYAAAELAAAAVAGEMGWDAARQADEVKQYRAYLEEHFLIRTDHQTPMVQPTS
jgi:glycerol-3-phosphate dehydrogenase